MGVFQICLCHSLFLRAAINFSQQPSPEGAFHRLPQPCDGLIASQHYPALSHLLHSSPGEPHGRGCAKAGFPRVEGGEGKEGKRRAASPRCRSSPPRPADARCRRRQRDRGTARAVETGSECGTAGGEGPFGTRGGAGTRVPLALLPAEGPGEEGGTTTLFYLVLIFERCGLIRSGHLLPGSLRYFLKSCAGGSTERCP